MVGNFWASIGLDAKLCATNFLAPGQPYSELFVCLTSVVFSGGKETDL